MLLRLVLFVALPCSAFAQMVVPASEASVAIGGQSYRISVVSDLEGPVRGEDGLRIGTVAGVTVCPNGAVPGRVEIAAQLAPIQQAKAMIHETVHIAMTCDRRDLEVDEKIAEDVSDLLNSAEGGFVLRELR